jgi:hypothetical protein
MRKVIQGTCASCGKNSRPDRNLCSKCAKRQSKGSEKRREEALQQGLCPACRVRPSMPGVTRCSECDTKYSKDQRERRAYRKAHGLCKECGLKSLGKTLCMACVLRQQLRNHNISEEDYKEQLNKQGICCACCGKPFDVELPCIDHRHNVEGCTHPQEVGCSTCFRSLMHNKCNAALGHLGDDPDTAIECMLRLKKVMKS